MTAPLLQAEGLVKRFKTTTAVDRVSLSLFEGTITALVGPDGAGKTTLIRILAGVLLPDEGSVRGFGVDIVRNPEAVRAHLGYMPQSFGLYEDLTVRENLTLYARLRGVDGPRRAERFETLLAFTGLTSFQDRQAGALSGGMKQKLGLACVLIALPKALMLDEPSVGVDPASRRQLWSMVKTLVRNEGMAVLWSTAYLDEAEKADQTVVLDQGALVFQGRPAVLTATMNGRSFLLRQAMVPARQLQRRILACPGVIDALPQAGTLRIVSETAALSLPDLPKTARLSAVPPRLEDAYVAVLRREQSILLPDAEQQTAAGEEAVVLPRNVPSSTPPIVVEGLCKAFGSFVAVDQVGFQVERGEVFGLLGPNGAGKSTTFKILCGLLTPSEGRAAVAGVDLRLAPAKARERLGYMAQKFSLYGILSVRQNLRFFAGVYGLAGKKALARVQAVSREFGLADVSEQTAKDLPLGYKQRLSLAAAVLHDPDILFLDEPTSGVDPLTRREFWLRIASMAERGVTILVTTHFMEEAEYCDRVLVMMDGRTVALGTPTEIKSRARSAALPDPSMEDAFLHLIEGGLSS